MLLLHQVGWREATCASPSLSPTINNNYSARWMQVTTLLLLDTQVQKLLSLDHSQGPTVPIATYNGNSGHGDTTIHNNNFHFAKQWRSSSIKTNICLFFFEANKR